MFQATGLSKNVDSRIINKIHQLVGEGVRGVREMERHIKIYVKSELFRGLRVPPSTNRRYHPKRSDIRSHMYHASVKLRFSKMDQENLELKIREWQKEQPEDDFCFRGYGDVTPNSDILQNVFAEDTENKEVDEIKVRMPNRCSRLLFCHQTKQQKRLLLLYGNALSLLDATYKTTKYSIPLFFLCVKTNVNYQIVASFAIQDETTEAITEVLKIISNWNPNWKPKLFMVDNCEEEIQSIESLFPGECF